MSEWFNPDDTKRQLTCILTGCKLCRSKSYCIEHDKTCADIAPGIPHHCSECGEYIMDVKKDTKGAFG